MGAHKSPTRSNSGAGCAVVEVHLQSQNIRRQPSGPLQHPPTPNPDIHRRPTFVLTLPGPKTPSQTPRRATPSPKHESNQRALCYNMNTKHCRMMGRGQNGADEVRASKLNDTKRQGQPAQALRFEPELDSKFKSHSRTWGLHRVMGRHRSTSRDCRALTASRVLKIPHAFFSIQDQRLKGGARTERGRSGHRQ